MKKNAVEKEPELVKVLDEGVHPVEEFYNVVRKEGTFFSIETVKIQNGVVISREMDKPNYLAGQLGKLKAKTFGKYFFGITR